MNTCMQLMIAVIGGLTPVTQAQEISAPPIQDAQPAAIATGPVLPSLPSRDSFNGILERPLFNDARRPQIDNRNNEALVSAGELREQWKLTGVVMVGDEMRAMLQQTQENRQLTLTPGMPLDTTWMLERINPDSVIMGSGAEEVRLELMTPRDTEPVATTRNVTANNNDTNTNAQEGQRPTHDDEPRRLRQSSEADDE